MPNISIQTTENKGSGKRYGFKVTETPGFFNKLFGAEDKGYRILVMSRRKIELETAKEMVNALFEGKELWKAKKGKKCDYTAVLNGYPSVTFFITNSTCNNESDNTNTNDSKEGDDQ